MVEHQQTSYEEQRLQASRDELVSRMSRIMREDGVIELLPKLFLARISAPMQKIHSVLEPSLCVIAQGSKAVFVGDTHYQYDPFNYFLATIEVPRASQVLEASREKPYLGFRLELDPNLVSSVLVEAGHIIPTNIADVRAMDVSPFNADLLDAIVRLVRLIDSPSEVRMLMPLVMREIIYRLLMSNQGSRLYHLSVSGGYIPHIAQAVDRMRQEFDQPIRVEDLAQDLGMSVSSFHQHFKSVTAMSPLQFQKRLRLQEARRLMLSEELDATRVAYRVGYNDASHFSREYKSLFGDPPMRDVQRLRESTFEGDIN